MVHYVSGWTRGVQVKLWDPLRTRVLPERHRGMITTRRYTNPHLPYLYVTCSYCPSHMASLPLSQYQIILLSNRGARNLTCAGNWTQDLLIASLILTDVPPIGLDQYRYRVSADTRSNCGYRYRLILIWVSAPVVLSFVYLSQQSTILQHTSIDSSLDHIFAHIPLIHISWPAHTYTPHKIAFSVQKICIAQYLYRYRYSCGW